MEIAKSRSDRFCWIPVILQPPEAFSRSAHDRESCARLSVGCRAACRLWGVAGGAGARHGVVGSWVCAWRKILDIAERTPGSGVMLKVGGNFPSANLTAPNSALAAELDRALLNGTNAWSSTGPRMVVLPASKCLGNSQVRKTPVLTGSISGRWWWRTGLQVA